MHICVLQISLGRSLFAFVPEKGSQNFFVVLVSGTEKYLSTGKRGPMFRNFLFQSRNKYDGKPAKCAHCCYFHLFSHTFGGSFHSEVFIFQTQREGIFLSFCPDSIEGVADPSRGVSPKDNPPNAPDGLKFFLKKCAPPISQP